MPDHLRPVEFGGNLDPVADFGRAAATARAIESAGLEFIGIQDHPYQRRFFETWTLMAALVPLTDRVHFVTDVANLQLRPAPMLAKAASSLDVISGGRVELGLGAGGFPEAVQAMGGPARNPAERVDALEEAIELMRLMWSGSPTVSFDGEYYSLKGHKPGPPPAHRIEIWLGALGPRMLRLTGSAADGWIPSLPYAPPEKASAMNSRIDVAAAAAHRNPAEIRRAYNVMGSIGVDDAPGLTGAPEQWVENLTSYVVDVGMDTFLFWPTADDHLAQFQLFGREVAPAVREAVARARR